MSDADIRRRIRDVFEAREQKRQQERKQQRREILDKARKIALALKNKRIVYVELNPFNTERDSHIVSFNPVLVLDDGSRLSFEVDETEVGDYGVSLYLMDVPK